LTPSSGSVVPAYDQHPFAAPIYQSYGRQIAEQRYEGGGILMSYKDVGLALTAGGNANLPLPLASLIRDSLRR
jgi:hypothetical protein